MFNLFRWHDERRLRDRRAARMLVRDQGAEASRILDHRIASTRGRDRAHWKRVKNEVSRLIGKDGARPGA